MRQDAIFAERYLFLQKIGIGGFSEVWKAQDQMAEDTIVAIKIYAPERGMDETGLKQFSREYSLLLNISHSKLLTARHFDVWEGSPYLVLPFCPNGSLYSKIVEEDKLPEKEIATILVDICSGLAHLHANDILHQDIKPENILINDKGNYLLTDFGISGRLRSTLRKSAVAQKALTMAYAAPELFGAQMSNTEKSDIFALGVLICEMATGDVPWMGNGGVVLRADSELPELPEPYSRELTLWMQKCMNYIPAERPIAQQILNAASNYLKTGYWQIIQRQYPIMDTKAEPKHKGRLTEELPVAAIQENKTQSIGRQTEVKSEAIASETEPVLSEVQKNKPFMLVWIIISIILIITISIVTVKVFLSSENQNTPEFVAKKYLNHINKKEFAEAKKFATEETCQLLDMMASFSGVGTQEEKEAKIENLKCETNEESSVCKYLVDGKEESIDLVKKNGKWLVDQKKESGEGTEDGDQSQAGQSKSTNKKQGANKNNQPLVNVASGENVVVNEEDNTNIIKEEVIESPIYTVVEVMPSYPGGEEARMKFLAHNINYPQMAKESGIQGTVYVTFVITEAGKVSDVKVLRGIGGGCDEEAIRVTKLMPTWIPGTQSGKPVRVQFNMPVRFLLN
ncbi:MAG TPA: TonB family protein [Bacteroidales bacterium]|nr:TonB family protein [Bacteroidales bacterium]